MFPKLIDLFVRKLIDLLFPRRCPLCDEVLPVWGRNCRMQRTPGLHVPGFRTGNSRASGFHAECREKLKIIGDDRRLKSGHVTDGRVLFEYACVAPGIYRFKYGGRREYAAVFAEEIYRELGETIREWKPDGLIAVPLHPKRLRRRGYNQAELLAKELSARLNVPFYRDLVRRTKNTAPLKLLNASERQNNLKKAFKMYRNDVKLNTIIIVDDIYTTGQTAEQMAVVLTESGIPRIYVIALAGGSEG